MQGATQPTLGAEFAAALDWWRDAGVDLDYDDSPVRWLIPDEDPDAASAAVGTPRMHGASANVAPAEPAAMPIGGSHELWPRDIGDFARWWLNEPSLDDGQVRGRVVPRGPAQPDVMIVVPQPEAADTAELLSGPEGRLLDAILAAAGISPEGVYRAAVLPRHTPLADWAALAGRGAGVVLAHHIGLVAPRRLIVFGTNILPLLGHDPAQSAKVLQTFNHEGRTIPLLGAFELGAMLGRPKWKAAFWQRWLDWTGTGNS